MIPYLYRTQGEGSSAGRSFTNVIQTFRIEADGRVTVTKGNVRVSRSPGRPPMVEPSRDRLERESEQRRDVPTRRIDYTTLAPER